MRLGTIYCLILRPRIELTSAKKPVIRLGSPIHAAPLRGFGTSSLCARKNPQDDFLGPVNIGSEEMVSINELAELAIKESGKNVKIKNLYGQEFEEKYGHKCPLGVKGRNSDNNLYKEKIGWESEKTLSKGISATFEWVNKKVRA